VKRHNCKYLFEVIIFFSMLTISGCEQKVSRNYGTSIDEETSVISVHRCGKRLTDSVLENNCANRKGQISNSLDIEYTRDFTIDVKIYSQADYEIFLNQLESDKDIHSVYMDLCDLDTLIYLDKLLENQNIRYLDIKNGGVICVRNKSLIESSNLDGIRLYHSSALQENMLDHFNGLEICIRLDDGYTGRLPTQDLLNNTDCESIILIMDGNGQLNGIDTYYDENRREWEYFYSVLSLENQYMKGLYRVNHESYSYTSYEFCKKDMQEICAAFVCVKDKESDGRNYFDMLEIPKAELSNISRYEGKRFYFGDINFDSYEDLIFLGNNDRIKLYYQCIGFLWDDYEKRYKLCETVPSNFKWIDEEKERLIYSTSGAVSDDEYYIYKYNGSGYEEERLEIRQINEERIIWKYFIDGELHKEMKAEFNKSLNSYTVIYYENGEIREETVIDVECDIWEIGKKYFPAFDFCNNG